VAISLSSGVGGVGTKFTAAAGQSRAEMLKKERIKKNLGYVDYRCAGQLEAKNILTDEDEGERRERRLRGGIRIGY
jgi:hypothetical protein